MECLHARIRSGVRRVHLLDLRSPLGSGLGHQSIRARLVRARRTAPGRPGQTARRDAGVAGAGHEDVRVGRHEHVCHHATRRRACDEHLGHVGVVRLDEVVDHLHQPGAVAASVVRQRLCGRHVPTVAVLQGARVDNDEALLVRVRTVVGRAGVLVAGSVTAMKLSYTLVCVFQHVTKPGISVDAVRKGTTYS